MSHRHDEHDHDFELEDTIVLIDEDETEHEFTILEYLEIDEQLYAVLVPKDDASEEAFIFRVEVDENGEETFMDIEDDDEFARVAAILEADEID
jgi:uncharacterized protein YrzB (UPF0473 family)